jgi:hypothetical protein
MKFVAGTISPKWSGDKFYNVPKKEKPGVN